MVFGRLLYGRPRLANVAGSERVWEEEHVSGAMLLKAYTAGFDLGGGDADLGDEDRKEATARIDDMAGVRGSHRTIEEVAEERFRA
ncbi:MAG: hypothetical protein OXG74_03770 [Acidobacteria bacterium]|nr:hypothetical protein [Acidobacteriota bacterium]